MEERYVYVPKQYFYIVLTIFLLITTALILDMYLIGANFYNIYFVTVLITIFIAVLAFSYFSYKGKIPYLVEYDGNLYASKYQVILTVLIFILLFATIPYIYIDRSTEAIITIAMIVIIGLITIIFTYLSYKKKIPLLRLKY